MMLLNAGLYSQYEDVIGLFLQGHEGADKFLG